MEGWHKTTREKAIEFHEHLRSGTWTSITLALPAVPTDGLGYLELSLDTPTISLVSPRCWGWLDVSRD
jgi:hypothetical protein